jgi:general secretion pathway protein K
MMMRQARSQDGFALIVALWALALVGVVAGGYLAESRRIVEVSANRTVLLHARQAALAGLERAHNVLERLHVLTLPGSPELDVDSRARLAAMWNGLDVAFNELSHECLGEACYELRVRDLGAALNVNTAGEEPLRRFLLALGIEARDADIAAQSIADWIDGDDLHRARGAEAEYYASLPFARPPRNGPIRELEELVQVRGVGRELFERAAPYLTVEGDGRINVNAAPVPVLATLPGLDLGAARTIAALRARGMIFANPFELSLRLRPEERAGLVSEMDAFLRFAVFEPRLIDVTATGTFAGREPRVTYRALYARAGDRVALLRREKVGS